LQLRLVAIPVETPDRAAILCFDLAHGTWHHRFAEIGKDRIGGHVFKHRHLVRSERKRRDVG
jgi:hypothetical protein